MLDRWIAISVDCWIARSVDRWTVRSLDCWIAGSLDPDQISSYGGGRRFYQGGGVQNIPDFCVFRYVRAVNANKRS